MTRWEFVDVIKNWNRVCGKSTRNNDSDDRQPGKFMRLKIRRKQKNSRKIYVLGQDGSTTRVTFFGLTSREETHVRFPVIISWRLVSQHRRSRRLYTRVCHTYIDWCVLTTIIIILWTFRNVVGLQLSVFLKILPPPSSNKTQRVEINRISFGDHNTNRDCKHIRDTSYISLNAQGRKNNSNPSMVLVTTHRHPLYYYYLRFTMETIFWKYFAKKLTVPDSGRAVRRRKQFACWGDVE